MNDVNKVGDCYDLYRHSPRLFVCLEGWTYEIFRHQYNDDRPISRIVSETLTAGKVWINASEIVRVELKDDGVAEVTLRDGSVYRSDYGRSALERLWANATPRPLQ